MKALKAGIKSQGGGTGTVGSIVDDDGPRLDLLGKAASSRTPSIKVPMTARRFHLSREQNIPASSIQRGGIRKPTYRNKSHIATFVERALASTDTHSQIPIKAPPIDRILEVKSLEISSTATADASHSAPAQKEVVTKHTLDQLFVKPSVNGAKQGRTINTHPDTWDFDSDLLAGELAALAFELDSTGNNEPVRVHSKPNKGAVNAEIAMQDEYVYETYIRLPHNADFQAEMEQNNLVANIGVLVIAEEDEELWEEFAESDDDDGWDEEDADSNGNS